NGSVLLHSTSISCYRYYDYVDLHPFPTRRSSDLAPRSRRVRRSPPASPGRCGRGSSGWCRRSAWMLLRFPVLHLAPNIPRGCGGDRKSTRLNSSHVKISYAVFCLKKKKVNDMKIE